MITGKGKGGVYTSYRTASSGNHAVFIFISVWPEDSWHLRIAFTLKGETVMPIIRLDRRSAEILWSALNETAKDLDFKDYDQKSGNEK